MGNIKGKYPIYLQTEVVQRFFDNALLFDDFYSIYKEIAQKLRYERYYNTNQSKKRNNNFS